MASPKIIFMGTPEFAVPSLESIHNKFGVSTVVTVPDKPQGRGRRLDFSEVKKKALTLGIPVLQPEKLKDEEFIKQIEEISPDIIVVIAFRILPAAVYTKAKLGAFNIHGSLLPKYRGAAPINHAIINGETKSGLTSFILQEKVDTGNILLTKTVEISGEMTAGDLHDLLMPVAAELSLETIDLLLSGNYTALPQNAEEASAAPKIFPEDCKINWQENVSRLKNFIHGVSPFPGAWTTLGGNRIKVFRCRLSDAESGLAAGGYLIHGGKFLAGADKGALEITELKAEGKKTVSGKDFANGWRGASSGHFDTNSSF